jgi:hypothetical protein
MRNFVNSPGEAVEVTEGTPSHQGNGDLQQLRRRHLATVLSLERNQRQTVGNLDSDAHLHSPPSPRSRRSPVLSDCRSVNAAYLPLETICESMVPSANQFHSAFRTGFVFYTMRFVTQY